MQGEGEETYKRRGSLLESSTCDPAAERAVLMADLDTRLAVQAVQDCRVRVAAPEVSALTCSDLLTAYRLTQNFNRYNNIQLN